MNFPKSHGNLKATLHICAVSVITISHLIHIQFSIEHAKHLFMFPMGPCIAKNKSFAKIPPKHKKTEDFLWELSNKRLDVVGVVRGRARFIFPGSAA